MTYSTRARRGNGAGRRCSRRMGACWLSSAMQCRLRFLGQAGGGRWPSTERKASPLVRRVGGGALDGGEAFPIGPEGHVSASPVFSPQGLLAYHDATLGAVVLADPVAGAAPPRFPPFPPRPPL